jgi:flagellin-specific chaperone FliS
LPRSLSLGLICAGLTVSDINGREPKPKLDRAIQDKIGRELRAMYEELLRQPLPENLTAPLRAIDEVHSSRQRLNQALEAMRAASSAQGAQQERAAPEVIQKASSA